MNPEPLPLVVEYLTVQEVAAMLKVSTKTVSRWAMADPSFPVLKVGAITRFPKARLEAWLKAKEQGIGRPRLFRKQMLSGGQGRVTRGIVGGAE